MFSFKNYVENKDIEAIGLEIIEHLVLQSNYFKPEETLNYLFQKQFGESIIFEDYGTAFGNQKGRWGNMWDKFAGGAKHAFGQLGGGLAGTLGGLASGATGAIKGFFGKSGPNDGIGQGMSTGYNNFGKNYRNTGAAEFQAAQQNTNNAAMVSAYKNASNALNNYVNAVSKTGMVDNNNVPLSNHLKQILDQLETISKEIASKSQGSNIHQMPVNSTVGTGQTGQTGQTG